MPPPLELDLLMLPEPLPEDDDDIDDPLDLLPEPDDEPPLLDDPLPEPDPDPLELGLEPEDCAVAGMSLWTHTPSAEKVFVPGTRMATVRAGASMRSMESIPLLALVLADEPVAGLEQVGQAEPPLVAAAVHQRDRCMLTLG